MGIDDSKEANGQRNLFDGSEAREPLPAYAFGRAVGELSVWLEAIAEANCRVFIKRLSANDTGATGTHQAGVYFPGQVMSAVFPSLNRTDIQNPDTTIRTKIESAGLPEQTLRAIYYNNRHHGGTRNEKRLTRWLDGVDATPIQDPESTGALAFFAFMQPAPESDADYLRVWICGSAEEENFAELTVGEIEPSMKMSSMGATISMASACRLWCRQPGISKSQMFGWKSSPKGRLLSIMSSGTFRFRPSTSTRA